MEKAKNGPLLRNDTDCGSLLDELQAIWNDIGESDIEKDIMLLELEKECLEIYRRKVDQANMHRAELRQTITDSKAEIATICSAIGERPIHFTQSDRSLKEDLKAIARQLEDLRERKNDRLSQFLELREQIQHLSTQIDPEHGHEMDTDESDLSIRKLEDLHRRLDILREEKNARLRRVLDHLNTMNSLCSVLDIDFNQTASEVHPSLDGPDESKNVSGVTIERLTWTIQRLREAKLQRMRKLWQLQDLATAMLEMWHLMDTPIEEQQEFQHVTCNIAASEDEITEPNSLSMGFINHVEAGVARLEKLKESKMKDLLLKKKIELDELCRRTHLIAETDSYAEAGIRAIETESLDPSMVLEQLEAQISIVKEEAFSRKEIVERVEKWFAACEEESWLEEYNKDENRYNAGKGTHLMLKRAEKARAVVSKIPAMVETMMAKIKSWESERGTEFIYDGSSLLAMVEEYNILRQEKEQERKRLRDQQRLQGQLIAEQEAMFGSKPSLSKSHSAKKLTPKRLSLGGAASQSPKFDSLPSFKSPFSARKPDGGAGDNTGFQSSATDAAEGEPATPRRPFTPLSVPHSIPSTVTRIRTRKAEEENKMPVGSPFSARKTPRAASTPKQNVTKKLLDSPDFAQEAAAVKMEPPETEISFEERRLAFLLEGAG